MIYVGIDVAKHKHDCYIVSSDGEILYDVFTVCNSRSGFDTLYSAIKDSQAKAGDKNIKVGLESTGQYSRNLKEFLLSKRLNLVLLNPLNSDSFRKARSLRKTKTDKTDARLIASMLIAEDYKPYMQSSYHIDELKSLTRCRFRLIKERSKLKIALVRLLDTLFPELSTAVASVHQKSVIALLLEFPSAKQVADAHLTRLTHLLNENSHGRYGRDKAVQIRGLARESIASGNFGESFELQSVIRRTALLNSEIAVFDKQIKIIMDKMNSPVMSVPGISYTLAAIIIAEISNISIFDNPDKLLAYAGMEPSTYQSGKYTANHARMVKHGSKYLRWALMMAAQLVRCKDPVFAHVYTKKRAEGKHHYVALSHVAKKLVRVIFHLLQTNKTFVTQAV
jgi:transposase